MSQDIVGRRRFHYAIGFSCFAAHHRGYRFSLIPELIRIHHQQHLVVYYDAYQITPREGLEDCAIHERLVILKVEILEFLAGTFNLLIAEGLPSDVSRIRRVSLTL